MESRFINYEGNNIHYLLFGGGKNILFCFHGFGKSADSFLVLEPALRERYTIIAIDLPLHGETGWQKGKLFLQEDLKKLLTQLLNEYQANSFSLMGYSMGGKMALTTVTLLPDKVKEVFLIAPDGLNRNIWYDISIYPEWGRRLFCRLIEKPEKYFAIIGFLTKLKLVPTAMQQFLLTQLETKKKRQQVFDVWDTIKDFTINRPQVKELLKKYNIPLFLFFGQFDAVIKPRLGYRFVKGLHNYNMKVLPKGHNLMKDYLNEAITEVLSK